MIRPGVLSPRSDSIQDASSLAGSVDGRSMAVRLPADLPESLGAIGVVHSGGRGR